MKANTLKRPEVVGSGRAEGWGPEEKDVKRERPRRTEKTLSPFRAGDLKYLKQTQIQRRDHHSACRVIERRRGVRNARAQNLGKKN